MRWDLLETLHCPYSGSRFTRSAVLQETGDGVEYGILNSGAGDFPVIAGILRLKVDEYRLPIVQFIKERKYDEALLTALEMPSFSRFGSALSFIDRLASNRGS